MMIVFCSRCSRGPRLRQEVNSAHLLFSLWTFASESANVCVHRFGSGQLRAKGYHVRVYVYRLPAAAWCPLSRSRRRFGEDSNPRPHHDKLEDPINDRAPDPASRSAGTGTCIAISLTHLATFCLQLRILTMSDLELRNRKLVYEYTNLHP